MSKKINKKVAREKRKFFSKKVAYLLVNDIEWLCRCFAVFRGLRKLLTKEIGLKYVYK
jgi:hypothetical protein